MYKNCRHCAIILLILCTAAVGGDKDDKNADKPDKDWQMVDNDYFSFSMPKSLKKADVEGIDSFVEQYEGEGIELSFDYGMYSNNFGDWPKATTFDAFKVDGEWARVGTVDDGFRRTGARHSTQIYFKATDRHEKLSMYAACRSKSEVAVAKRIFKSIRFKRMPEKTDK